MNKKSSDESLYKRARLLETARRWEYVPTPVWGLALWFLCMKDISSFIGVSSFAYGLVAQFLIKRKDHIQDSAINSIERLGNARGVAFLIGNCCPISVDNHTTGLHHLGRHIPIAHFNSADFAGYVLSAGVRSLSGGTSDFGLRALWIGLADTIRRKLCTCMFAIVEAVQFWEMNWCAIHISTSDDLAPVHSCVKFNISGAHLRYPPNNRVVSRLHSDPLKYLFRTFLDTFLLPLIGRSPMSCQISYSAPNPSRPVFDVVTVLDIDQFMKAWPQRTRFPRAGDDEARTGFPTARAGVDWLCSDPAPSSSTQYNFNPLQFAAAQHFEGINTRDPRNVIRYTEGKEDIHPVLLGSTRTYPPYPPLPDDFYSDEDPPHPDEPEDPEDPTSNWSDQEKGDSDK